MNQNIKIFNSYTKGFNTIRGNFPVYIATGKKECGVSTQIAEEIADIENNLKENLPNATVDQTNNDVLILVDANIQSIINTYYLELQNK